jgi:hypothetical protein
MNTNNNETVTETGLATIDDSDIHNLIHTVRGLQVMLDSDVAQLYGYETKNINLAAKRNIERFPERYRFQLSENELNKILRLQNETLDKSTQNLRLQNETANKNPMNRYLPYVYTEQGVAMLSGLLKNKIAVETSIQIMDAFVYMRQILGNNNSTEFRLSHIETKMLDYDNKFGKLFNTKQFSDISSEKLFFKDKHFDAYKFVVELIKTAKSNIIVIDNYLNNSILDIFSHTEKSIEKSIITTSKCKIDKSAITTFEKQHGMISIIKSNEFHDRFIILDNNEIYAFGGSLKDLGSKTTTVNKLEDPKICSELISRIENISSTK